MALDGPCSGWCGTETDGNLFMNSKELEMIVCALQLKLGALEERVEYLEERCSLGTALHLTSSTTTGAPFYTQLGHNRGTCGCKGEGA